MSRQQNAITKERETSAHQPKSCLAAAFDYAAKAFPFFRCAGPALRATMAAGATTSHVTRVKRPRPRTELGK